MKDKALQASVIKEGKSESGIYYRLTSTGAARQTLALVMGYGGSLRIWPQSFIDRLATMYDILTFDNRGTGLSFLPPLESDYTTELMAGDLDSVVKSLGLSRFHLLGYSMGGCIAIEYAHRFRQKVQSLFCSPLPAVALFSTAPTVPFPVLWPIPRAIHSGRSMNGPLN